MPKLEMSSRAPLLFLNPAFVLPTSSSTLPSIPFMITLNNILLV